MLVPIPELASARRLLCVQPHYDDNDIGAGGTVATFAQAGAVVRYVTVTDDLLGIRDAALSDDDARAALRSEQERAAELLGVDSSGWLGYADAGDYDYFAVRRDIVREIRAFRPDFVLTCDPWMPYEAHSDHVRVGRAVAEAALLYPLPRLRTDDAVDAGYTPHPLSGVAFYFSAQPNTFSAIDSGREQKHRALDCYRSQLSETDLALLHAALTVKERQWAETTDAEHAEAFKVVSPIHLHVNPDAEAFA